MTDITMCDFNDCPMQDSCWRLNAPPDLYNQSYAGFRPDKDGNCRHYLPTDERPRKKTEFYPGMKLPEGVKLRDVGDATASECNDKPMTIPEALENVEIASSTLRVSLSHGHDTYFCEACETRGPKFHHPQETGVRAHADGCPIVILRKALEDLGG